MITRAEHVAWCKERALEYVEMGDLGQAVASMVSDMNKHPATLASTAAFMGQVGLVAAMRGDADGVRRWIEGFN
jgi:hypothetical protein